MNDSKNGGKSLAMFVSSMLIFGTIGIFRRGLSVSSGLLAFARGVIGALFLCVFVKIRGGRVFRGIGRKTALWYILSGCAIGLNWMLLFEAYRCTSVTTATLCYYMQPTIVILLSPLLFKEKLTVKKILCALAAVAGMALVSGFHGAGDSQLDNARGIACGLGAAALYASVVILNKKAPKADVYQKSIIQLFSAALVMLPSLLFTRDTGFARLSLSSAALLLTVGVVHTGVAYALYFGSMDGLKAQTIAIFSYIDPVSALFFSMVFLHEAMTPLAAAGAALILGAAFFSEWTPGFDKSAKRRYDA